MNNRLPIFNWSYKKLLLTEDDLFNKARIKILYAILLFSILKSVVVLVVASLNDQYFHIERSIVALLFYLILLKIFLIHKSYINPTAHVMIWMGIIIIWTNIFISVQGVNIITLQFIFMMMISSFYFLNNKFLAILYSTISALPVVIYKAFFHKTTVYLNLEPEALAVPGNLIIDVLNFTTLITVNYLFIKAFNKTVEEKETLNIQLKKAVEEANMNAQSKSDFLSTMSHELRTPLNSVIGMTDLLLDNPIHDEQKENLNILHFSAVSLNSLINDILDFNKLDSDKLKLEMISVNLDKLINNICSGLELQAKEKGLNLVLQIDEEIKNKYVITDSTRITQIIYNLVGNGIKFTSTGSVTLSLKTLSNIHDIIKIRFSIDDTGIGIPIDKQAMIFEPFIQASASTTRNFGGTGLGLSIVKRLLILFGSEIHLESAPNFGSRFFFDISFKIDHKAIESIDLADTESHYDLTGLRVLIAEDNQMNIVLIKKVFAKWNIEPVIAENGIEVVHKLLYGDYDVILMDIHMPQMDGYFATKNIRNMSDPFKSKIPIIALSASVSEDMSIKIKEAGMNDYLRKPLNAKELYVKLRTIKQGLLN